MEFLSRVAVRVATNATWVLAIVIFLSLLSSAFSIRYLSSLQGDIDEIYENEVRGQTYAQNAYVALVEIESEVKDLVLSESEDYRLASATDITQHCTALQALVRRATLTMSATRYRTLISNVTKDVSSVADTIRHRLAGGTPTQEQARALLTELEPLASALRTDIATINDVKRTGNTSGLRAIRIQLQVSLATTVIILLLSITVRLLIYRSSRPAAASARRRIGK